MGSGPGTESAPSPCRTSWLTNLDGRALLAVVLAHYVPSEYFPNAPPANCHPLVKSGPRKQVKLNRGTLFAPVLKLRTAEHPGNWHQRRRAQGNPDCQWEVPLPRNASSGRSIPTSRATASGSPAWSSARRRARAVPVRRPRPFLLSRSGARE